MGGAGIPALDQGLDVEDESIFFFEEEWKTREDLENHQRSDHFGV